MRDAWDLAAPGSIFGSAAFDPLLEPIEITANASRIETGSRGDLLHRAFRGVLGWYQAPQLPGERLLDFGDRGRLCFVAAARGRRHRADEVKHERSVGGELLGCLRL